jgi:hypothetical protein
LNEIVVATLFPRAEMGQKGCQKQTSFPGSLDPFTN